MSIPSTGRGKWLRNGQLARYLGISNMTLWRWKNDPDLGFPDATEINGIEFNDLDRIDEWMRTRVVKRHGSKR
jgi:hypothetical protein